MRPDDFGDEYPGAAGAVLGNNRSAEWRGEDKLATPEDFAALSPEVSAGQAGVQDEIVFKPGLTGTINLNPAWASWLSPARRLGQV